MAPRHCRQHLFSPDKRHSPQRFLPPDRTQFAQSIPATPTMRPALRVLSSSSNPATASQQVTFTANVRGQDGSIPSGTVAFTQGSPAVTWGTAPLINGQASITTAFPAQGSNAIAAVYLGAATYQTGASQ